MNPSQNNVADMFAQLFQPVEQFPRWFQPTKDIGGILVQSQEEEDELKARDWTPKPLPGSENPVAKIQTLEDVTAAMEVLQSERALFEQQRNTLIAEMDARLAQMQALSGAPGVQSVPPAPAPETSSAADVPGGLSDASEEVDAPVPDTAPVASAKASKK